MQEDLKKVIPDNSGSREYKFRVFLPKHDVTDTISMSEQMYYCDNFLKVHQATHCNSMDKITRPFYIMQYTGLKDKNGVEIYEGDIVRVGWGYNGDHKIKEHDEVVKRDYNGYYLERGTDSGRNDVTVIGNIYQGLTFLSEK